MLDKSSIIDYVAFEQSSTQTNKRIGYLMNGLIDFVGKKVFAIIVGVVSIVVLIAAVIAGLGILTGLVSAVLFAIIIYFGSVGELAASIVIGYLLKKFAADIHNFAGVWWTGNTADKFFGLVNDTGYFDIIIVIFFFAYSLSFFTSRVQILTIRLGGSIESKEEKKEE